MPTNKDFKHLVRGRMQKTGESYTAARAQLRGTNPRTVRPSGDPAAPVTVLPTEYARLAGVSDAAIKAKTGCIWERWVDALDRVEAHTWSHGAIATYVHEKYKVPSWWTQTVTVGYERIKGLRAKGQRRDGGYNATKSKTFAVPVSRLYRAFNDKRNRARWLPGINLTVRTATKDRSMRITWPDGTSVDAGFVGKGSGKSLVALAHQRLPDKATAERVKVYWAERLEVLKEMLAN